MIKVVIADDEERICQLINALIDWNAMKMEIVGIAHNGIEAIEMTERLQPDILITDIRMPGCSGLELIERTKQKLENLEIVIISGYAHFEYAQQAIKFGVGDYLLKPINKMELKATLEKLSGRICQRKETEQDKQELLRKAEQDVYRLQMKLLEDLTRNSDIALSLQELNDTYHLQFEPGVFQAFWMKVDAGKNGENETYSAVLMEKAREILERGLKDKCRELILGIQGFSCIGIMNYENGEQEKIRKAMKGCLSQLELQKSLYQPAMFSAALGSAFEKSEDLSKSMQEAHLLIQERLLKGTGRLFERLGEPSALGYSNVLEKYLREITQAVEVLNLEQSNSAVDILIDEIKSIKDLRGCEVVELVNSAADIFAVSIQMQERAEYLETFRQYCDQCRCIEELFEGLRQLQNRYIQELIEKQENDTVRPIRKAKQYIQNHFSEPITQEEVSSFVGLSAAYFSVLFKKTEGEGFAKYLINVRMEQAKVLLRETNISVAEICRKVGYNDLKHFTHTFEKSTGVKPATYRKLYG